jgi:RimJ/RimL family protein N-acetyltransferase
MASIPPERIVLRDLVLRRWSRADAAALTAAVRESFEHLHQWMSWAAELPSLDDMRSFLDTSVRQWDSGEEFAYAVLDESESTLLGAIGVHDRVGPGGWEIGYWVHVDHTGRGIATTGAAAVTGALMSFNGTERAEIHCDRNNRASAAVAARLGYRLDRIEDDEKDTPGKSGKQMVWIMTRDSYPGSAAQLRAAGPRR